MIILFSLSRWEETEVKDVSGPWFHCIPGDLILSVLVEDHKVLKQVLLYMKNTLFLAFPAHPVLPRSKEDCEGQALFSPPSPSACFLCFPFVFLWLIVAVSPRWKSVSHWHTPQHPGAVEGWCCPRKRGNSSSRGGAEEPLPWRVQRR